MTEPSFGRAATLTSTKEEFNKLKDELERKSAILKKYRKIKDFHLFGKLPVELQLNIWKLSLPGPRFVEMRTAANQRSRQYDLVSRRDDFTYSSSTPTLLHVCRASRNEALRHYTLAFHQPKYSIPVYFDFEIDTLYLRDGIYWSAQIKVILNILPDKDKVQNLAVTRGLGVALSGKFDIP